MKLHMKQYIFVFGNHPILSLLELKSVAETVAEQIEIKELASNIAEVTCKKALQVEWWQKRLGGVVKIAEKIGIKNENEIADFIKTNCEPQTDKYAFGISSYTAVNIDTNKLGMIIKRYLTEKGVKVRFVVSREKILSSVIVKKNKLLTSGNEFILVKNEAGVIIAQTITVQDFEAFGERDFGRPAADAKNGMLPPKLAKIMINLAKVKNDAVLVDPFCGSGTVLQEALLMGIVNVKGSDLSEVAVKNTKININWLAKKNEQLDLSTVEIEVVDALSLKNNYANNSIDAIVTEPYLGPVDRSNVSSGQNKIVVELEKTYNLFIKQVAPILKSGGHLVIIVPIVLGEVFNYKKALVEESLIELFPAQFSVEDAKYSRFGQRIERLIVVANKPKK